MEGALTQGNKKTEGVLDAWYKYGHLHAHCNMYVYSEYQVSSPRLVNS